MILSQNTSSPGLMEVQLNKKYNNVYIVWVMFSQWSKA